jgi:hypothetical protein
VRIDSLALQMRPRAPHEAADLGIRLCQSAAGDVYRCFLVAAVPVLLIALALYEISPWWSATLIWCAKPWLDRSVLFVLGRAAFGQRTSVGDLWSERRAVWWRQFLLTWTWRRLSPWRSFTQPVYQLEGLGFFKTRRRVVQLRRRHSGAALFLTMAFAFAELGLVIGVLSLLFLFAPPGQGHDFDSLLSGEASAIYQLASTIAYALAVLFLEPFYVAAGFGMYLNRRAELEAWDIEQEFRRAFPA